MSDGLKGCAVRYLRMAGKSRSSTFLRALLDRSNSGVLFSDRAWLRTSWR
jgi:hypothetical protein